MTYNSKEQWIPHFKNLQLLLKKSTDIESIKTELLYLHSQLHQKEVHGLESPTYYDEFISDLNQSNFNICPTAKNMTVAWDLWHITRIEDLTTSILLCQDCQVFDGFRYNLGTDVTDTGNAMTDEEIFRLGSELSLENLLRYRKEVGKKTRKFIEKLTIEELSRRFSNEAVCRIKNEGGVIPQTLWLMDYWGKKTVSGIITMPMTKHQILHLNDVRDIILKYKKKQKRS